MYNTIIFDLDGTILNTTEGVIKSAQYALAELKLELLKKEEYQEFIALSPLIECFKQYRGVDNDTAAKCCELYKKYYAENAHNYTKIYDGIIVLLEYLKKENYKTAIATYKNETNAKKILTYFKLDKYFDVIKGADDCNKLTKKDIIENCLKELNSSKENSVMIGDTASDAIAAENAEIDFIGVTYGFAFKNEPDILPHKYIFAAHNALEIKQFLNNKQYELV